MNFLKFLFLLFFVSFGRFEDNSTLVLLQIVHRHGDRTPISFYKNDPYKGEDKWLDGLGELTPRGKDRMYDFGKQLRKRYGDYLGDTPKNIYLRSSASDRCLESASALASGLYPPKNRWIWGNDLLAISWQPIAIQTELKSSDGLLVPNSVCPAADAAYEEVMRSKEVTQFMASQKEFIAKIEEKTGEKYTKLRQLDYLYDTINAELTFDEPKPVPKWINELGNDTLQRLKQFEWNAFKYDWSSKKVQRLRAGLILKELTTNMQNVVKGQNHTKKVYSYATHDTQIVTIMQSLDLYSGIPPSYGSALLFELRRLNGQHFVHLVYANLTPTLNYEDLELRNCRLDNQTERCHLNGFVESVKEFIPNDWHKECQISTNQMTFSMSNKIKEKDEPKICSNDGTILHLSIGFISGFLFFSLLFCIKVVIDRCLPPNQNRFFQNSYSLNSIYKKY